MKKIEELEKRIDELEKKLDIALKKVLSVDQWIIWMLDRGSPLNDYIECKSESYHNK